MIPILDLKKQYLSLEKELNDAIRSVLGNGRFIMGPNVKLFENEIAAYIGTKHAVGVNSGTDALHLALRALDIGAGDEVITTPFTFVATTEAIGIVGATPVFVDIDPDTFNIDVREIEKVITPRTKAILPIHLYGRPAAMPAIMDIARRRRLAVVEDCAQSIGSKLDGTMTGAIGDIGCFSFFPSKNLGACGDAGMITTNSDALAQRMRNLRAHGAKVKYHHEELGVNSRLDELQAAILRVKLPHLESWISARRSIAQHYTEQLHGMPGVVAPNEEAAQRHVYHQYTVRVANRDAVKQELARREIETMVYYPVPLHLQKVHESLGYREGAFPRSEAACREVLSLPMFPELSEAEQDQVVRELGRATAPIPVA